MVVPGDDDTAYAAEDALAAREGRWSVSVGDRTVVVPRAGLVAGRATDAAIRLMGGLVSRSHARFRVVERELFVTDLASRNGVLVNERRIAETTRLRHGDVVTIGIERLEIIDRAMAERPPHLSTMPPPSRTGVALPGDADVDGAEQTTVAASVDVLSARERQVLELVVLGHTQAEIAKQLHVSVKTVETHRAHIADKLECRTRAEMVAFALSAGVFEDLLKKR